MRKHLHSSSRSPGERGSLVACLKQAEVGLGAATPKQSTPGPASVGTAPRQVPLPPLGDRSASEPATSEPPRLSSSYNSAFDGSVLSDLERYQAMRPRPVIGSNASVGRAMHRTMSTLTWSSARSLYGEALGAGMSLDSAGPLGSVLGDPVYVPQQWYEPLPDLPRIPHFRESLLQEAVQGSRNCQDRRDWQFGQVLQSPSELFRENGGATSMVTLGGAPIIGSFEETQGFPGMGGQQALCTRGQSLGAMSMCQYSRSYSGGRRQNLQSWGSYPVGEVDLGR